MLLTLGGLQEAAVLCVRCSDILTNTLGEADEQSAKLDLLVTLAFEENLPMAEIGSCSAAFRMAS